MLSLLLLELIRCLLETNDLSSETINKAMEIINMPSSDAKIEPDSFVKTKSMNRATFSQPRIQTISDIKILNDNSKISRKEHRKSQETIRKPIYHSSSISLNMDNFTKLKNKFNEDVNLQGLYPNLNKFFDVAKIESSQYPNLKSIAMNRANKVITKSTIKCVLPTIKMNKNSILPAGRSLSSNKWINTQRVGIKVDFKAPEPEEEEDSVANLLELKSKYLGDLSTDINIFNTNSSN